MAIPKDFGKICKLDENMAFYTYFDRFKCLHCSMVSDMTFGRSSVSNNILSLNLAQHKLFAFCSKWPRVTLEIKGLISTYLSVSPWFGSWDIHTFINGVCFMFIFYGGVFCCSCALGVVHRTQPKLLLIIYLTILFKFLDKLSKHGSFKNIYGIFKGIRNWPKTKLPTFILATLFWLPEISKKS